MLIKFLRHSTGSGKDAINYLLGERDHRGEIRAGVDVLRGDPHQIGRLIDSLDTVHRYTSGVIAFHPEDKPTPEQIDKLLNEFERTAFAGLEGNQYTWAAVQHIEQDGSTHIHVVAPRVELTSGKAMNIAPPGWERLYDPLRDAFNAEQGWRSPADPEQARDVQPGQQIRTPDWGKGEDPRQVITEWLTRQAEAGMVESRADVLAALASLGEVTRQGKDYVSVRLDGEQKPVRLKGAIYGQDWTAAEAIREAESPDAGRSRGGTGIDYEAATRARQRLERGQSRRAEYNARRYRPAPAPDREDAAPASATAAPQPVGAVAGPARHPDAVRGDAGRDVEGRGVENRDGANQQSQPDTAARPAVLRPATRQLPAAEADAAAPKPEPEVTHHDRARSIADRAIEAAKRAASRAAGAVSQATRAASTAAEGASRAAGAVSRACRAVDAGIGRWLRDKAEQRARKALQREIIEQARVRVQQAEEARQRAVEPPRRAEPVRERSRGPRM